MLIELQCSNCGKRTNYKPMLFWKMGWRFTGVPYCPHCVETWKERNGKEWNEQYDEEQMEDEFYEYLFDKIEMEKVENEKYVIYEDKNSIVNRLNDMKNEIWNIQRRLGENYESLEDCSVSELIGHNQDNNDLIDETLNDLENVADNLIDFIDEIENLEIY